MVVSLIITISCRLFISCIQIINQIKISLAVLAVLCLCSWAYAGPVAVVDKPVYAFETVPEGVKIKHVFIVKNSGDTELSIDNIVPP